MGEWMGVAHMGRWIGGAHMGRWVHVAHMGRWVGVAHTHTGGHTVYYTKLRNFDGMCVHHMQMASFVYFAPVITHNLTSIPT